MTISAIDVEKFTSAQVRVAAWVSFQIGNSSIMSVENLDTLPFGRPSSRNQSISPNLANSKDFERSSFLLNSRHHEALRLR